MTILLKKGNIFLSISILKKKILQIISKMEVSNKDCKTQVGKNLGSLPFSKNAEKIFLVKGFQHLCDHMKTQISFVSRFQLSQWQVLHYIFQYDTLIRVSKVVADHDDLLTH